MFVAIVDKIFIVMMTLSLNVAYISILFSYPKNADSFRFSVIITEYCFGVTTIIFDMNVYLVAFSSI